MCTLSHYSQLSHQQFHVVSCHSVPDTRSDGEILGTTCTQETLCHNNNDTSAYMHVYLVFTVTQDTHMYV